MLRDIILFGVSVGVLCLYFAFLLYEWFLNNKIYQCIKNQDVQGFLSIQKKGIIKRKIRSKVMFIISKILT